VYTACGNCGDIGSGVKYQKAGDMELIIIIVIVAIAIFGTWAMLDG